ncbi:MAG: autotransporter domain-containing protein [Bosea sp. (in: a-proteobacteria)]
MTTTRKATSALALLAVTLMSTSALAQQRYIAFGDSLSDSGNLFAASGQPPAPYFNGRFSNGRTWVELLSGVPMSGFFPVGAVNNNTSTNFSFGGARTDAVVANPPGTGTQIGAFLARGGAFTPGSTVTLWAGANDIFQALPAAGANPATAQAVMQGVSVTAATNVGTQTGQLAAAGARQIIVLNLPNFGSLPQFAGTAAAGLAGVSSAAFNTALTTTVGAAAAASPAANVTLVDIGSVFSALQASAANYGFTNVTQQCLTTPSCVGNPTVQSGYAFYDGVHPTAAGHQLIAAVVTQYMQAPILAGVFSALGEQAIDERRTGMSRAFDRLDNVRFGKLGVNDYFVNAYGGVSNGDSANNRPRFRSSNYGVNFGMNRALSTNWGLTASGSVGVGTTKIASILTADTFNAAFDLGAIYNAGNFFAKGGLGLGVTRFGDMERTTVGPLSNKSSTTAVSYNAGVEAGYIHTVGMFELSPRARLAWLGGTIDKISETGIVAPLSINSRNVNAVLGGVELRATANIVNTPGQKVAVTALVGYERYLTYSGNTLAGRIIGNTSQGFRNITGDPKGPGVIFGLGLSSQMASGWVLNAEYRASVGERNLVRHNGQIGIRTAF